MFSENWEHIAPGKLPLRHQLLFWRALLSMWLVTFFSGSSPGPFVVLCIYCVIYNMMCGVFFWLCLFGVLCTTCVYLGLPFLSLRRFSPVILLKICSVPLTWNSSSVPVIHRFDVSQCPEVPEYLCVCVSIYHIIWFCDLIPLPSLCILTYLFLSQTHLMKFLHFKWTWLSYNLKLLERKWTLF